MYSQKEEQKINPGKYLLPLIPDVPFPCLLANKVAWPTVSFSRKSLINFFMRTTSVKLKKVKCTILKLCSCHLSITVGVFNTLATCYSVLCGKYTFFSLFTMWICEKHVLVIRKIRLVNVASSWPYLSLWAAVDYRLAECRISSLAIGSVLLINTY
jgi:hypothetical protein